MSQSGYTPILVYASGTATNLPLAADLTSGASGAELALNYADGKLYFKNSSGVVTLLASSAANAPVLTFSAGTTGFTPSSATSGAVTLAGTLATGNGGTDITTYTTGDILYASATNVLSKIGIGSVGTVLTVAGGVPTWSATSTVSSFSAGTTGLTPATATSGAITLGGTLAVANGGTGVTSSTGTGAVVLGTSPTLTTPVINGFTGDTSVINIGSGQVYKDASGNVGIGVTPSAWNGLFKAIQVGGLSSFGYDNSFGQTIVTNNAYGTGSGTYAYLNATSLQAARYEQKLGTHAWFTAPAGTVGNAITFTTAMTLDASGNLGIGNTVPQGRLDVTGLVRVSTSTTAFPSSGVGLEIYYDTSGDIGTLQSYSRTASAWKDFTIASNVTRFSTAGAERMRIHSSGGLSIGNTTDPGANNLSVTGSASAASFIPTSATVPTNGMFYPTTNTVGFSANTLEQFRYDTANINFGKTQSGYPASGLSGRNFVISSGGYNTNSSAALSLSGGWANNNTGMGWNIVSTNTGINGTSFNTLTFERASYTGSVATSTEMIRVSNSGGVSIGNATDPGATNLSVTGSASAASFIPTSATVPTNGMYLPAANSVGIATSTANRIYVDASGNVGIGFTPNANSGSRSLSISSFGSSSGIFPSVTLGASASDYGTVGYNQGFTNTANSYKYLTTDFSSIIKFDSGGFKFYTAPSGTAGNAITFTQAMTLHASGGLSLGNTVDAGAGNLSVASPTNYLLTSGLANFQVKLKAAYVIDTGPTLGFFAAVPSIAEWPIGYIAARADGTSYGGYLQFATTPSGGTPTERMRIDSSGNLGLGVTPSAWNVGKSIELGGVGTGLWNAGTGADIFLSSNVYYNSGFKYAQTNAASTYEQNAGVHYWRVAGSGTAGAALTFTQAMSLNNSGGCQHLNTISVGNTTPSTSGAGITFPATQSASTDANTLDDYEEGTWTPVIAGNTTAGVGTYTVQAGSYTKIGNRVFFNGWVVWTAHTGTGSTYVDGLPFTVANSNNAYGAVSLTSTNAITLTAGNVLQARMSVNVAQFLLLQAPTGGGAPVVVPMSAAGGFMVSGQYYI